MDTRTTAAVGGIGVLAFMLVGIGLWQVAGVLDSMTNTNINVALETSSATPALEEVAAAPRLLPRAPRQVGTGSAENVTQTEKTVSAPITVAGVGTLDNLLALKSDLTCTVSTVDAARAQTGTVYLSSNNLRGDFTTTVDGHSLKSAMIDSGGYLYAWMDTRSHGVRLLAASTASGGAIASYGGVNPNQEISYRCNLWKADMSEFNAPNGVTFTDTAGN